MEGHEANVRLSYETHTHTVTISPILCDEFLPRRTAEDAVSHLHKCLLDWVDTKTTLPRPLLLSEEEYLGRWKMITSDDCGLRRWKVTSNSSSAGRLGDILLGKHTTEKWWRLVEPGTHVEKSVDGGIVWVLGVNSFSVLRLAEIIRLSVWRGEFDALTQGSAGDFRWVSNSLVPSLLRNFSARWSMVKGLSSPADPLKGSGSPPSRPLSSGRAKTLPPSETRCKYDNTKFGGCGDARCRFLHLKPRGLGFFKTSTGGNSSPVSSSQTKKTSSAAAAKFSSANPEDEVGCDDSEYEFYDPADYGEEVNVE